VSQPQEGFGVELMGSLAGHSESPADGGEGLGWRALQAVASDDEVVQGLRQAGHQTVQGLVEEALFHLFLQVGSLLRWVGSEEFLEVRLGLGHGPPDSPGDGGHGVGAEGGGACGVIAPQSPPQGDAAHVQGLGVGKSTQPLSAHHPVH